MDGSLAAVNYTAGALVEDRSGNRQPGLQPAAYVEQANFTTVPLDLAAREAVFIVVRGQTNAAAPVASVAHQTLATLNGPWTIAFQPHLGAPSSIQLSKLTSWTESSAPGVKYFSGTGTYSTTFTASAEMLRQKPGARIVLHFDNVRDIAAVKVNGKSAGSTWAPPYEIDVTDTIRPGINKLEIAVTNEWTNRIIGDRELPVEQRILSGVPPPFRPGPPAPLPESGLIGNVTLLRITHLD
jgi:hypothetical protein